MDEKNEPIRVFISVPMKDRSDEEIDAAIYEEKEIFLKTLVKDENLVTFVDNFHGYKNHQFYENTNNKSLSYIGEAFKKLATCSVAVFGKGWKEARGCMMEAIACTMYDISIIDQGK